jgi:phenylacetate-CoA ligase
MAFRTVEVGHTWPSSVLITVAPFSLLKKNASNSESLTRKELPMNLRETAYFALVRLRGQALGTYYKRFLREDRDGIPPDTSKRLLIQLLAHCKQSVPYYAEVMRDIGDSFYEDPEEYLKRFPILTKETIRRRFGELRSTDLARRKWYRNTSGGSTGEPAVFIQDWEYAARSGAVTLLFSKLAGREIGESEVRLWGSLRDIVGGTEGWRTRLVNKLTDTTFLSVLQMTPSKMRELVAILNAKRPKLIVAYAEVIYELARFAEREGLEVAPQAAIMTSAGMLYPFMRATIEKVFQCRVFNRYGSREVGNIACERPGREGLWVAPWGNYVEIVDSEGNRVPDGTEGEILVTSLTNFAMPFVRYRIGDRGVLSPVRDKSPSCIVFRIVKSGVDPQQAELDEISARTRTIMGDDCEVAFEFADEIVPSDSGKYRFIISEVQAQ